MRARDAGATHGDLAAGLDHDDGHLRRLVRLEPDAKPDPIDLVDYAFDIHYEEVQKDLLLWLLPFCLRAWRDDLRGQDVSYGGFVEGLYPALVDGGILDRNLEEDQRAAVALFMREAILEEIDDQAGLSFSGMNARPYRWVYALTTYGVLHPDLEQLWTVWWAWEPAGVPLRRFRTSHAWHTGTMRILSLRSGHARAAAARTGSLPGISIRIVGWNPSKSRRAPPSSGSCSEGCPDEHWLRPMNRDSSSPRVARDQCDDHDRDRQPGKQGLFPPQEVHEPVEQAHRQEDHR